MDSTGTSSTRLLFFRSKAESITRPLARAFFSPISAPMRCFPAPGSVETIPGGFNVVDANGQSLAYVYGYADPHDAGIAKALTLAEARRIASNIAKLPNLLAKDG
jgi:hypothetical protein